MAILENELPIVSFGVMRDGDRILVFLGKYPLTEFVQTAIAFEYFTVFFAVIAGTQRCLLAALITNLRNKQALRNNRNNNNGT